MIDRDDPKIAAAFDDAVQRLRAVGVIATKASAFEAGYAFARLRDLTGADHDELLALVRQDAMRLPGDGNDRVDV